MASLQGISVKLPATYIPSVPPQDFVPDTSSYDPEYDKYIVIAGINAGLYDHIQWIKLRVWLLGLPTINDISPSLMDIGFPSEHFITLFTYIKLKHQDKTDAQINTIFRSSHYFLSCHCTWQLRTDVLDWIDNWTKQWTREYNNSVTPRF